jgi:hypothetical protein
MLAFLRVFVVRRRNKKQPLRLKDSKKREESGTRTRTHAAPAEQSDDAIPSGENRPGCEPARRHRIARNDSDHGRTSSRGGQGVRLSAYRRRLRPHGRRGAARAAEAVHVGDFGMARNAAHQRPSCGSSSVSGIGASFTSKGGGQSHVLRACGFIERKGVSIAGGSRAQEKPAADACTFTRVNHAVWRRSPRLIDIE